LSKIKNDLINFSKSEYCSFFRRKNKKKRGSFRE